MNINFKENIKSLRKKKEITQEVLAEYMDVSVQAVSKWECGQSYPDIESLPKLAEFLGVTIDSLLMSPTAESPIGEKNAEMPTSIFPNDNVLRIVQYKGNRLLSKDDYDPDTKIPLILGDNKQQLNIEIWGSADIEGNISGEVTSGTEVNCGGINGGVDAGNDVNCGGINGGVTAGNDVNCGDISGDVTSGNDINCNNIKKNVLTCGGDIHCNDIKGNVACDGNIYYNN